LVLGEELVKVLEEHWQLRLLINDDSVVVVAGGADADEADIALPGGQRQAVDEGVVGLAIWPHEEPTLGTASGDEIATTWDDCAG
jgi:hypothetical protein